MLHLSVLPCLSAIYYALLRCGYQPAGEGKDAATVAAVNGFRSGPCTFAPAFWQDVRQASCQVYPY